MVRPVETAIVKLWGHTVGAVAWLADQRYAVFEYTPEFLRSGLDISPIHMSLDAARSGDARFSFPALNHATFLGLPGLLADALPDKFGNSIIDAWLARQGRDSSSFSPVERLCYTGRRGMGALEFEPAIDQRFDTPVAVEIAELVNLAQQIMQERSDLKVDLGHEHSNAEAIADILRVGTSAGGARPKAVIAMNAAGHVLSGQIDAPDGYDYWILKFDGVTDLELGEPRGYGRIEYAYYRMAQAAGIHMTECRLLQEDDRAHFMTRRFDRQQGRKLHMQTLCGLAHYDFNQAGAYSYEQLFQVMRRLRLSKADAAEQFRRIVFNILARDLDDHTKNVAFLMGADGRWQLAPAYDVTYAHNPKGRWTNQHQMSLAGKRESFSRQDLLTLAESISLSNADELIEQVTSSIDRWPEYARDAGIKQSTIEQIGGDHLQL